MSSGELIVVAVAVLSASFVQTLSGFGFALLSMPLMTLALPVERAVIISTLLGMMSSLYLVIRLRHDADVPLARRMILAAYVGMPLGLLLLDVVDDRWLRVALGVSVLIASALLARKVEVAHLGAGLDLVLGFTSGVLNTSLSTNGPPLVFGLQARKLSPDQFRATLSMVFAICNIGGIALFAVGGKFTNDGVIGALIAVPAWLLGLGCALPLRRHIHGERFRRMVLGLLTSVGVMTLAFAL